MNQTAIFHPFIAMILLTFGIMLILVIRRSKSARRRGFAINQLPSTKQAQEQMVDGPLWDKRTAAAGDHLANLFETPVLFYVLCIAFFVLNAASPFSVGLAWAYVGARFVHAFVHLTYNLVGHRFYVFVVSILILMAMTGTLFLAIA